MSKPLLDVSDLHSFYGASHILHGIGLRVGAGDTVALLGRNGMGKTTLIRSILGLVRAQEGSVRVRGVELIDAPTHRIIRHGLAYVPEGRGIFPNLSVRENLLMAARAGFDGRMDWTLERVLASFPRLDERLNHGGAQLSGGEQQMLSIGRALMTNPQLLILDEATEGLAPKIAEEIWQRLRELRESGLSCLIVDRNLRALRPLANRFVVLVKGRVVFDDVPDALDNTLVQRYLGV